MQNVLPLGTQASTSAVTASTSGANIAYWSLLRGKSGPPTEVGRFVRTPRNPYAHAPDTGRVCTLIRDSWMRATINAFGAFESNKENGGAPDRDHLNQTNVSVSTDHL